MAQLIFGPLFTALYSWPVYLLAVVPTTLMVWFACKCLLNDKISWSTNDLHIFWVPHIFWAFLIIDVPLSIEEMGSKSLTNSLYEPFFVGLSVPIIILVKICIEHRFSYEINTRWLLIAGCISATLIWVLVPSMPE